MELKPACCNSKLLFFADFGHRCFPEHLIIKRRLPENFNYSHNLKILSKVHWASSVEKTMDTCGVAEHLMLPCCCFMSLSPKLFLLCFSVLFLQDCLRLPTCIPSCIATLHLWALPIYSLCSCVPSVKPNTLLHSPWLTFSCSSHLPCPNILLLYSCSTLSFKFLL